MICVGKTYIIYIYIIAKIERYYRKQHTVKKKCKFQKNYMVCLCYHLRKIQYL